MTKTLPLNTLSVITADISVFVIAISIQIITSVLIQNIIKVTTSALSMRQQVRISADTCKSRSRKLTDTQTIAFLAITNAY